MVGVAIQLVPGQTIQGRSNCVQHLNITAMCDLLYCKRCSDRGDEPYRTGHHCHNYHNSKRCSSKVKDKTCSRCHEREEFKRTERDQQAAEAREQARFARECDDGFKYEAYLRHKNDPKQKARDDWTAQQMAEDEKNKAGPFWGGEYRTKAEYVKHYWPDPPSPEPKRKERTGSESPWHPPRDGGSVWTRDIDIEELE